MPVQHLEWAGWARPWLLGCSKHIPRLGASNHWTWLPKQKLYKEAAHLHMMQQISLVDFGALRLAMMTPEPKPKGHYVYQALGHSIAEK